MPILPDEIIAVNIGELRKSMHMNKREFADMLSYDPSKITRLEQGVGVSNIRTIEYIALKCNVDPLDLLTPREEKEPGNE